MADIETLAIGGRRPETATGSVGVVMRVVSGKSKDTQWFDYRPGFFSEIVRVEWDIDTMNVVLPLDVSEYLLRNNYARVMTNEEAREFNRMVEEGVIVEAAETPPRRSRKGEAS